MTELTKEEKALLFKIINDKYSVGAFAGMIFNAHVDSGASFDFLIQKALQVRLEMTRLIE